jgi:hypothetical protein
MTTDPEFPGEPPLPRPLEDIPECFAYPIAAVILRRPAQVTPSRADRQILRLLIKAAASAAASRDTVPWSFFVTGPDGCLPLLTREEREQHGLKR